jgi:hypothetical protein
MEAGVASGLAACRHEEASMVRSLITGLAAALALAAAVSAADAQTVRHHRLHYAAVRPGDIVVHARSYLDPGAGASAGEIGTGNRYVTDTAPPSLGELGPTFGNGAFDYLPSRFNPPGRPEPLFDF